MERKRSVYAGLLLDTVRRHSLLPSDVLQKKLRLERVSDINDPITRKAIFSHKPLNIVANTWFFFVMSIVSLGGEAYALFNGLDWNNTTSFFSSVLMAGGQPVGKGVGGDVVFRLSPIKSGNDTTRVSYTHHRLSGFGIVQGHRSGLSHCGINDPPKLAFSDDGSMNLTYASENAPVALFGAFVVHTPCSTLGGGPKKAGSPPCDESFHLFGQLNPVTSRFHGTPNITLRALGAASEEVNQGIAMAQYFRWHSPWPAYISPFGIYVAFAILLSSYVWLKLARKTEYAHLVTCSMLCLVFVPIQTLSAVGFGCTAPDGIFAQENWENAFNSRLQYSFVYAAFAAALTILPRFPDIWLAVWGICMLSMSDFLGTAGSFAFFCACAMGSLIFAYRLKLLMQSKFEMGRHRSEFEKAWQSTLSKSEDSLDQLARLEGIVGVIAQSIPTGTVARQFQPVPSRRGHPAGKRESNQQGEMSMAKLEARAPGSSPSLLNSSNNHGDETSSSFQASLFDVDVDPGQEDVNSTAMLSSAMQPRYRLAARGGLEPALVAILMAGDFTHDTSQPIESMDQLWTQAMLLRGPLLTKVLDLANKFDGLFPVRDEPGNFEKPEDYEWVPLNGRLRMGAVKSVHRGIEKVDCAYGGDASRLLDVCREMIVFESIKDMGDCLEELGKDPEVFVVRIKSSITKAGLNPVVPSGLHLVSVNMRIQNYRTRKLAVSAHVCELLLILRRSAELITPKVQEKYVRYRNSLSAFHLAATPGSSLLREGLRFVTGVGRCVFDLAAPRGHHNREIGKRVSGDGKQGVAALPVSVIIDPSDGPSAEAQVCDPPIHPQDDLHGGGASVDVNGALAEDSQAHTRASGDCNVAHGSASSSWRDAASEAAPDKAKLDMCMPSLERTRTSSIDREACWGTFNGVQLTADDIDRLEAICRIASMGFAEVLDKAIFKTKAIGLDKASWFSLLFVADASAMASIGSTQCLSVFLGICTILWASDIIPSPTTSTADGGIISGSKASFSHFRYTNLADKNGNLGPAQPGVKEFGILHQNEGGCSRRDAAAGIFEATAIKYDKMDRTVREEGPSITVEFDEPVPFYGWYLRSGGGGADTSNFDIHARAGQDGEWSLVGRPGWRHDAQGFPHFEFSGAPFSMPESRELTLFEPMVFEGGLSNAKAPFIGYGIGLILYGIMGFLRCYDWSNAGIVVGCFIGLALEAIIVAGNWSHFTSSQSMAMVACGLGRSLTLMIGTLFKMLDNKRVWIALLQLACMFSMIYVIINESGHTAIGPSFTCTDQAVVFFACVWGGQIVAWIGRYVSRRRAIDLVDMDKGVYDAAWKEHLMIPEERVAADHLAQVIKVLGLDEESTHYNTSAFSTKPVAGKKSDLHQCNRKFQRIPRKKNKAARGGLRTGSGAILPEESAHGGSSISREDEESVFLSLLNIKSVPGRLDSMSQVVSLDQLYVQAILLSSTFKEKVKVWAMRSEGLFPVMLSKAGPRQFYKWSDIKSDPRLLESVNWPVLKRSTRCFEKLARAYKGKASRLLDITRLSLYFDRIEDITMALGAIMTDTEVQLLRAKNRLKPDSDTSMTAGFRSVHLNLRISTKETVLLGCDTHVCEIQLVMRKFGDLGPPQGHKRYRQFRDLRGE